MMGKGLIVDTPRKGTVSSIIKFTAYETKRVLRLKDQSGLKALKERHSLSELAWKAPVY